MNQSEFNIWPSAIIILFIIILAACAWTVKIAQDHPVELDNLYRQNYDYINQNINQILTMSETFDRQGYQIVLESQPQKGTNALSFQLLDSDQNPISNAKIDLLITRRATSKHDIPIGLLEYDNGYYRIQNVNLDLPGIWVFNLEIQLEALTVNRLIEVPL